MDCRGRSEDRKASQCVGVEILVVGTGMCLEGDTRSVRTLAGECEEGTLRKGADRILRKRTL